MSIQWKLSICSEPFWLLEAMACMNYIPALDSEEWLNRSSSWNRRQKEEFLVPYRSYRGAMRAGLQPIFEQYPMLAGYVDTAPRKRTTMENCDPPMISFLYQMQTVLEAQERPAKDALERELNLAFGRMLDIDLRKAPDAAEPVILSLPDVMAALEGWEGGDADKFKLLRLYSERHEVMEQLWSLQGACAEIGRGCLAFVRERFDACMEKLQEPELLASLLDEVGLQCGEKCSIRITPAVIQYDAIRLQTAAETVESEPVCLKINIGIETFYMTESKREDFYRDDQLLSELKALGDPTRLKILHQLVERPCYIQEMAKELELTPATVLHHLGILMTEKLIEVQMTGEKKRIYYQVRRQGIQEVSQGILQLTLSRQEREILQRERQLLEGQQRKGDWQWTIQE